MTNLKLVAQSTLGLALATLLACGSEAVERPKIVDTDVDPATWSISGVVDNATFTVATALVDFDADIKSVKASVVGTNITLDLMKAEDIAAGELWSGTTELMLWTGISAGTYQVSITAEDVEGHVVTEPNAATVTVTN
jgi:hypothetical protein